MAKDKQFILRTGSPGFLDAASPVDPRPGQEVHGQIQINGYPGTFDASAQLVPPNANAPCGLATRRQRECGACGRHVRFRVGLLSRNIKHFPLAKLS